MLEVLIKLNPDLKFLTADDYSPLFRKLEIDASPIINLSKKLAPAEANSYIANDSEATALSLIKQLSDSVFGEVPLQAGWCFGGGKKMNGMEWHKSSEINIACSDTVLLLGDYHDVKNDTYDSARAVALYLKKGESVELYPLTLHLAPLSVYDRFIVAVLLPMGTNYPLDYGTTGTLRMKNKWLIVHSENTAAVKRGAKVGVIGANVTLKTK